MTAGDRTSKHRSRLELSHYRIVGEVESRKLSSRRQQPAGVEAGKSHSRMSAAQRRRDMGKLDEAKPNSVFGGPRQASASRQFHDNAAATKDRRISRTLYSSGVPRSCCGVLPSSQTFLVFNHSSPTVCNISALRSGFSSGKRFSFIRSLECVAIEGLVTTEKRPLFKCSGWEQPDRLSNHATKRKEGQNHRSGWARGFEPGVQRLRGWRGRDISPTLGVTGM